MGLFVIVMFKVFFCLQFITHSVVLKSINKIIKGKMSISPGDKM